MTNVAFTRTPLERKLLDLPFDEENSFIIETDTAGEVAGAVGLATRIIAVLLGVGFAFMIGVASAAITAVTLLLLIGFVLFNA